MRVVVLLVWLPIAAAVAWGTMAAGTSANRGSPPQPQPQQAQEQAPAVEETLVLPTPSPST